MILRRYQTRLVCDLLASLWFCNVWLALGVGNIGAFCTYQYNRPIFAHFTCQKI